MPTPLNPTPLQIEKAAGTSSGRSVGLWQGFITSGAAHLAGGLLLGSVWGTTLVQLIPPPYGTNAIQLTAAPMVVLNATLSDDPQPPIQVSMPKVERQEDAGGNVAPRQRQIRSQAGEMPPASSVDNPLADAPPGPTRTTTRPMSKRSYERPLLPPPDVKPTLPHVLKRAVAPPRDLSPHNSADPATPSERRQGQDDDALPRKEFSPAPAYPAIALRQQLTGRVVLRVRVDVDGTVMAASVMRSSGHAILDEAALEGVRRWRFQPARGQLGVAIEKEIAVPIAFRIDRSP